MAVPHSSSLDRVRELCRQLKPILGEKMEQVFQAYLAEDEPGKEQLEAYLELLQAKHLPVRLDQLPTHLVPPNPTQAYGEYELGRETFRDAPHVRLCSTCEECTARCIHDLSIARKMADAGRLFV